MNEKPSDFHSAEERSFLAPASVITLVLGLLSIAVSLYLYYASQARPAITIEQLPSITYAATQKLTGLGNVTLTVNGRDISELRAIPFVIRNTGNVPVSSIQNGPNYNLVDPLVIGLQEDGKPNNIIKIVGVQVDGPSSPLSCSFNTNANLATVSTELRSLNSGNHASFTVLYEGQSELSASLMDNPLLGGNISLIVRGNEIQKASIWVRFKSYWLAQGLGVIFLAQFPVVMIILIFGARRLRIEMSQDKNWEAIEESPEKLEAERDIKQAIESDLQEMISSISDECHEKMKNENILVPLSNGWFDEDDKTAALSVFEIFKDGLKEKWRYSLERKYPLPKQFDRHEAIGKWVITPWSDWEDYFKEAILLFGLPSVLFCVLGYALLFI